MTQVKHIGERLREWRNKNGWSQQQVATHLGIGSATILRWEKEINLPGSKYRKIIENLITEDQPPTTPMGESPMEAFLSEMREDREELSQNVRSLLRIVRSLASKPSSPVIPIVVRTDQEQMIRPPAPSFGQQNIESKEGIIIKIDSEVYKRTEEEAKNVGMKISKLIECILWNRYNRPLLSFQTPRPSPGSPESRGWAKETPKSTGWADRKTTSSRSGKKKTKAGGWLVDDLTSSRRASDDDDDDDE